MTGNLRGGGAYKTTLTGGITITSDVPLPSLPILGGPAEPAERISEEECVRHGGHCFEGTGVVLESNPPQYPQKCKHCGKGRVAIPQEPYTYRDWP